MLIVELHILMIECQLILVYFICDQEDLHRIFKVIFSVGVDDSLLYEHPLHFKMFVCVVLVVKLHVCIRKRQQSFLCFSQRQ